MPRGPKFHLTPEIEKLVTGMASVGATGVEIADYLGVSTAVVSRRLGGLCKRARAGRKIRLRRLQWTTAEGGSVAMQIWLGKQELGQSDSAVHRLRVTTGEINEMTLEELDAAAAVLGIA